MIVRDEERNLCDCLGSVAVFVDEVVIADTGSTDRTRDVAARFGARVVESPWNDHFAAARNAALAKATGDWIFWLDADDRLDLANRDRLRDLFGSLDDRPAAYFMRQANAVDNAPDCSIAFDRVHLWRHHPEVRWERRVHEQVLPALERIGTPLHRTDISFQHQGYQDPTTYRRKADRNLRLLELERAEAPDDPFTLFNLAWTYYALGRLDEAIALWKPCADLAPPGITYRSKLHALWTRTLHGLDRRDEALRICQAGRLESPADSELTFLEALLRRQRGEPDLAERLLRELLIAPVEKN